MAQSYPHTEVITSCGQGLHRMTQKSARQVDADFTFYRASAFPTESGVTVMLRVSWEGFRHDFGPASSTLEICLLKLI